MKKLAIHRTIYQFDSFRLDPEERRLSHGGATVALPPKAFDTLIALVENAGNLVQKDEMHKRLWPDTFVEDVTLARNIADVRAVLGQHSKAKYIETVPKHGYRFIGEVRHVCRTRGLALTSSEAMVAVLPFDPIDLDDSLQIFCDGLAEEIIHTLSCSGGLKVVARGSSFLFRKSTLDLRRIASELDAGFLVQGSVRRWKSGFRVIAQLIDVTTLAIRWSEQFERDPGDLIEVQDSIARAIVAELKPRLDPANLITDSNRHSAETSAWHWLWQGRHHQYRFTLEGLTHAEECFEKAIAIDPGYALAYLGFAENQHIKANLAMARPSEILPKAADAISRALNLESNSGDLHAAAGVNAVFWNYDWPKAERHFARALALKPSSSSVHHLYSFWWLRPQGRLEEAIIENREALNLDPLSPFLRVIQAYLLYLNQGHADAISLCEAALGFDRQFYLAHRVLGHIWQCQGKIEQANQAYSTAVDLSQNSSLDLAYFAASCALMGNTEMAEGIERQLLESSAHSYVPSTVRAVLDLSSGRLTEASRWLERAVEEHDPHVFSLSTDPMWKTRIESQTHTGVLSRLGLASPGPPLLTLSVPHN